MRNRRSVLAILQGLQLFDTLDGAVQLSVDLLPRVNRLLVGCLHGVDLLLDLLEPHFTGFEFRVRGLVTLSELVVRLSLLVLESPDLTLEVFDDFEPLLRASDVVTLGLKLEVQFLDLLKALDCSLVAVVHLLDVTTPTSTTST